MIQFHYNRAFVQAVRSFEITGAPQYLWRLGPLRWRSDSRPPAGIVGRWATVIVIDTAAIT